MPDSNITIPDLPDVATGQSGQVTETMLIHLVDITDPTFENPTFEDGSSFKATLDQLKFVTDGWRRLTIDFTALNQASSDVQVNAIIVPPKGQIVKFQIKPEQAFTGVGTGVVTAEIGLAGDPARYLNPFELQNEVGDNNKSDITDVEEQQGWTTTTTIVVTFRGQNTLDNLQSGSLDVYFKLELLP